MWLEINPLPLHNNLILTNFTQIKHRITGKKYTEHFKNFYYVI
jgi:hypothetical protein